MKIEPKVLNTSNRSYGCNKEHGQAWGFQLEAVLGGGRRISIKDKLDRGGYHEAVEDALHQLDIVKQGTIQSLEWLDEASLACFFMLGQAYLKMGEIDNAIGAFHVVYSQIGFAQRMLDSPVEFAQYCELAKKYLEEIADAEGAERVSNYDIESFFKNVVGKKKGGCFIASAAFDSPFAPEVVALRKFRNDVISQTVPGRVFIRLYYFASPCIARLVSSSRTLKTASRAFLTRLVRFLELRK